MKKRQTCYGTCCYFSSLQQRLPSHTVCHILNISAWAGWWEAHGRRMEPKSRGSTGVAARGREAGGTRGQPGDSQGLGTQLHWQCLVQVANQTRAVCGWCKKVSKGREKLLPIRVRLRKASGFYGFFVTSTVWCFFACVNPMLRSHSQMRTPIISPSFDFSCPGPLQWHSTLHSSSNTLAGFLCSVMTVCKINPVEMASLIQETYHSLAGASDLTHMHKDRQHHDEEIDIKLKFSGFLFC